MQILSLPEGNFYDILSLYEGNNEMNTQSILQIILGEFRDKLLRLDNLVPRQLQFPNAPNKIKVAIGMRRAGKTYFLYQHVLSLLKAGIARNAILYINFEDDRLDTLGEERLAKLVDSFYSLYPENHDTKCYFFFDEIHLAPNWQTVIRRLQDSKNVDIYLSGSSAKLLSKEIATNLRGRSLSCEVWPFSFDEYLRAKKIDIDRSLFDKKTQDTLSKCFLQYLTVGGFPEVTDYDPDVRIQTLQGYIELVILRDIVERHEIKNPLLIKYMIQSMIHNTSRPFAINKFYNDVKSRGFSIGKDTLYEYADYIEDAFLTFSVPLYDKSFRKQHSNPKKIYSVDPGLARALTLDFETDLGRLFENVVYLELRRRGCKVNYYLTEARHEVDFLVHTLTGHKKLFQITWNQDDIKTREREQRALEEAKHELKIEGEIITLDSFLSRGIKIS